ncbi:MAG: hypothetical protein ACI9MS_002047 [Glaciecola sp.]|jgi:hypothetical protein
MSVGWDTRMDLPYDISENSIPKLKLLIVPEMEVKGGALQVSFVQEVVFWAHDIGIKYADIPWD